MTEDIKAPEWMRPRICPDLKCILMWRNGTDEAQDEGYSWDCLGKLEEPHEFKWNKVVHRNEYCHCIYTPLKGLTKFLITAIDAEGTIGLMRLLLKDAHPATCSACGTKGHLGQTGFWQIRDKIYCPFCLYRISEELRWDEDAKVYVWH